MSISDRYKIPAKRWPTCTRCRRSASSTWIWWPAATSKQYLADGPTITKGTVPDEVGPALDAANRGLGGAAEGEDRLAADRGVAGRRRVGPGAAAAGGFHHRYRQRLPRQPGPGQRHHRPLRADPGLAGQFRGRHRAVVGQPQRRSARRPPSRTPRCATGCSRPPRPPISSTRCSAMCASRCRRRWPTSRSSSTCSSATTRASSKRWCTSRRALATAGRFDLSRRGPAPLRASARSWSGIAASLLTQSLVPPGFGTALNSPPPCLTGFLPASEWRAPADTCTQPLPSGTYCKIPKDYQGNVVRGARNYPCADVPGKRAATPRECRSNEPYVPLGTNPWYGDPNQILTCPAPAARCDQPVDPGR